MNKKTISILCVVLIVILAIGITSAYLTKNSCEKTNLTITSNDTLTNGELVTLKLSNESDIGIANKTINIQLTYSNNNTESINVTTDSNGIVNFTINLDSGIYFINATFNGDEHYKNSNATQNLTINEIIIQTNIQEQNSHHDSQHESDEYHEEIVYSTDPNSDKSVLDENGNIDQSKVDYYNQLAHDKYGPIG